MVALSLLPHARWRWLQLFRQFYSARVRPALVSIFVWFVYFVVQKNSSAKSVAYAPLPHLPLTTPPPSKVVVAWPLGVLTLNVFGCVRKIACKVSRSPTMERVTGVN